MGFDDSIQHTDHAHLIQTLSAMMIQLNALQVLVQKDTIDGIDEAPLYHIPDMDAIRSGLSNLEQMTEAVHVASAIRGGASLVHGVQMRNAAAKVSIHPISAVPR